MHVVAVHAQGTVNFRMQSVVITPLPQFAHLSRLEGTWGKTTNGRPGGGGNAKPKSTRGEGSSAKTA